MKNENLNQLVKVVTIAGSAILVVNSGMKLTRVSDVKSGLMPVVSILVGISAFKYAMSSKPILKKS